MGILLGGGGGINYLPTLFLSNPLLQYISSFFLGGGGALLLHMNNNVDFRVMRSLVPSPMQLTSEIDKA